MKNLFTVAVMLCFIACSPQTSSEEGAPDANPAPQLESGITMGTDAHVEAHQQMMALMSAMDFDGWGELLADNVEYHFPDGDSETRTTLNGKQATLDWWTEWKATSGVTGMTFGDGNYIPIMVPGNEQYPDGAAVLSYVDTEVSFENGNSAKFRMALNSRWADGKIFAIYSYYDRTGIIEAMGGNILTPEEAAAQ